MFADSILLLLLKGDYLCTAGLEANTTKQSSKEDFIIDDMDFTSFTQDEYNISKTPSGLTGTTTDKKNYKAKGSHKGSKDQSTFHGKDDSSKISRELYSII